MSPLTTGRTHDSVLPYQASRPRLRPAQLQAARDDALAIGGVTPGPGNGLYNIGVMTMPTYQPPAPAELSAEPFSGRPPSAYLSTHLSTNPSASAGRRGEGPETDPDTTERFRVFSLDGELAFVDVGRPYEETIRLAQRAYPRLQAVDPDRIQFFLPCGPTERARIPRDAWQGMMRRTRSFDRVFVHIQSGEAAVRGAEVGAIMDANAIAGDGPLGQAVTDRQSEYEHDVGAS
ncbi:hypothetical protein K488DRAFT_73111 [Vararia minispora EC-137]|uniref:Uncharacterized protein n=1 Tax=Vararia minispora EC-137 TaxID=1314806 RepID=A0ACB8QD90_9AGAM|nr:hypothetical protein K488DRAFT_73111 [Vararia minispora EC-137]